MATLPGQISAIVDDVTNNITLTIQTPPTTTPPPAGVREDLWYLGAGPSWTFVFKGNRATTTPQIAYYGQPQPDGTLKWFKVTLQPDSTWGAPVEVPQP